MTGLAKRTSTEGKGMGAAKAAKIVGIMFMSRTYAHMAHLKTSSYNVHMALNDFYDADEEEDLDVVDLADSLAEVAQGKWGKIDVPFVGIEGNLLDPANGLRKHLEMVLAEAEGCEGRALNAIVDQIEELYLKTIYLIDELK
jgi:hypothetical protein